MRVIEVAAIIFEPSFVDCGTPLGRPCGEAELKNRRHNSPKIIRRELRI
jgi:hypothetical protein